MKVKNISYPHPVLGNGDDILEGTFNPSFRRTQGRDTIRLNLTFGLKHPTVEKLIAEGKAVFTTQIGGRSTFYRTQFVTTSPSGEFTLDSNRVRGVITVHLSVRAIASIDEYMPIGCNPDYEGISFRVNPGDILAVATPLKFIADKEFDPLRPTLKSLLNIRKGEFKEGPMQMDYSGSDKIVVFLSESDWESCRTVKGAGIGMPTLLSGIALPALADALLLLKNKDSEVMQNHWYQQLEIILQQQKLVLGEPFVVAQQILKNPLTAHLKSLIELTTE